MTNGRLLYPHVNDRCCVVFQFFDAPRVVQLMDTRRERVEQGASFVSILKILKSTARRASLTQESMTDATGL
jgi:hypothetical protein